MYFIHCWSFITWAQYQPQCLHTYGERRGRGGEEKGGGGGERETKEERHEERERALLCDYRQEIVKEQLSITFLLSEFSETSPLSFASAGLQPDAT